MQDSDEKITNQNDEDSEGKLIDDDQINSDKQPASPLS